MAEVWKPIAGTEYEISSGGSIRSWVFRNRHGRKQLEKPKYKALHQTYRGYIKVSLYVNGKVVNCLVHRLVLEAFSGPCPDGHEAAHLNGNRIDNRISNLKWVTRKENHGHKKLHGTHQVGERNPFSRLNWAQVEEIRKLSAAGKIPPHIARQFNVSANTIRDIVKGRSWKTET